ncbi:hypothetical protein AgCh_012637 [Apium graveolens]
MTTSSSSPNHPENYNENTHTATHQNDTHNLRFDKDNSLHLQNSDSTGMKLVSDNFDGTGFSNWKRSLTIALSTRNKLVFVDGSIPKPALNSPSFKCWSRCTDMSVFVPVLVVLHKTLSSFQQNHRVLQFLMGLNDSYSVIRGSILMSSQLPSTSQVYNLLLQEETQREIHDSPSHFMKDAVSLNVQANRSSYQTSQYAPYKFKFSNDGRTKSTLQCTYCKKSGKKFVATAELSHNCLSQDSSPANGASKAGGSSQTLTPEMYSQLTALLKNAQPAETATSSGNFADNFPSIMAYSVACLSDVSQTIWIIDSGANDHMCFNKHLFSTFTDLPKLLHISPLNGNTIQATSI